MTREEAVSILRRLKRDYREKKSYIWCPKQNVEFQKTIYIKCLIDEMIKQIRCSHTDPITTVRGFQSFFSDILGDSDDDHFETHRFAGIMEYESGNILRYLLDKERK